MVQYNKVNVKLSYQRLNQLKTTVKNQAGVALKMKFKMFHANNLPHELLLTARQTTRLRNEFENNMSSNIKLSKAEISKIIQSAELLGSLSSKLVGPSMKVAVPPAKRISTPLGITAAAPAIDAEIQKKTYGFRITTLKVLSNE